MAQFDLYRNPNEETNTDVPYLLDVQHDLLDSLATRMVIPLRRDITPVSHLNPSVTVHGETLYLSTAEMAGISTAMLGEHIDSLTAERQQIIAAIDFLVTGF